MTASVPPDTPKDDSRAIDPNALSVKYRCPRCGAELRPSDLTEGIT